MDPDEYEEWYYNRPHAKNYLNDAKIWVNLVDMIQYFEPERVFEFSSELGQVLKEAQKRNINIIGTEVSDYAIKNSLCKERIIKIGEILICKLPFEDNSFDLVFSSEVLEHVKEEHTDAVIKELNRISSKYALLTINTQDPDQPGHINMHPRSWWLRIFEESSFKHDDEIWADLNKMKYLSWDLFVFKKIKSSK
jgi:SAM-dependent methyltransferase